MQPKLLSTISLLVVLSLLFYACGQKESLELTSQDTLEQATLQDYMAEHTQLIEAVDLGEGTYKVTGEQGTVVNINNALVNAAGERVRGNIEIKLIEIYSVTDMILLRKQTMADYDGQLGILESGGEIFIKVYQNGEELIADGKGDMNLLLPTANTGGPNYNMELFYGEEIGEQVIWKPTGQKIEVINDITRNELSQYMIVVQEVLGWLNVDLLNELQGEPVECLNVMIECPELCEGQEPVNMMAAIYVNSLNSAFELMPGPGGFELCGNFPLGGIQVTLIVMIECPDGSIHVAIVTTTISTSGNHTEVIDCENLQQMDLGEFEATLNQLTE